VCLQGLPEYQQIEQRGDDRCEQGLHRHAHKTPHLFVEQGEHAAPITQPIARPTTRHGYAHVGSRWAVEEVSPRNPSSRPASSVYRSMIVRPASRSVSSTPPIWSSKRCRRSLIWLPSHATSRCFNMAGIGTLLPCAVAHPARVRHNSREGER